MRDQKIRTGKWRTNGRNVCSAEEICLIVCVVENKNLAIADRSRVSCAHNTLRASIGINITP